MPYKCLDCNDDVSGKTSGQFAVINTFVTVDNVKYYRVLTMKNLCSLHASTNDFGGGSILTGKTLYCNDNYEYNRLVRKDSCDYLNTPYCVSYKNQAGWFSAPEADKSNCVKLITGTVSVARDGKYFNPELNGLNTQERTYKMYSPTQTINVDTVARGTAMTAHTSTIIECTGSSILKTLYLSNAGGFLIGDCSELHTVSFVNCKLENMTRYAGSNFYGCKKLNYIKFDTTTIKSDGSSDFVLSDDLPGSGTLYINWNDPNGTGSFRLSANCVYKRISGTTYDVVIDTSTGYSASQGFAKLFKGNIYSGNKNWVVYNAGTEYGDSGTGYGYY